MSGNYKIVDQLLKEQFLKENPAYREIILQLIKESQGYFKLNAEKDRGNIISDLDRLRVYAGEKGRNKLKERDYRELLDEVREFLSENHRESFTGFSSNKSARKKIEGEIKKYLAEKKIAPEGTFEEVTGKIIKEILDYGILTDLLEDETIEEIRVNDYDDIRAVIDGKERVLPNMSFRTPEDLLAVAQKIIRNHKGPTIKRDKPYVRVRMGNSARVSICINPIARRADDFDSCVTQMVIRKQRDKAFSRDFLLARGSIDDYGDQLLSTFIGNGLSTAFYGGTNSGKTATMSSYISRIPKNTRILSVAEIDEMNLREKTDKDDDKASGALMWEIRPEYGLDFKKLINYALTFTPETLVLQEMKGEEAVDIINASITGHQVITTLHADNLNVFGKRILGMYKQSGSDLSDDLISDYVAEAFDIVVQMKLFKDGSRKITEIAELLEYDRGSGRFLTNILYQFQITSSYAGPSGLKISGEFKKINPFSDKLMKRLIEKAVPSNILVELRDR